MNRWRAWTIVALMTGGFGMAESPLTAPRSPAEAAQGEVAIRLFAYAPSTLTVPKGTTVTWTNGDDITHTVTVGAPGQKEARFDGASGRQRHRLSPHVRGGRPLPVLLRPPPGDGGRDSRAVTDSRIRTKETRMNRRSWIRATGAALFVALVGITTPALAAHGSKSASDLRTGYNVLLAEHVFLAAAATDAALGGRQAGVRGRRRCARRQLAGSSPSPSASVYGADAEKAFLPLWRKHIGMVVDYTVGVADQGQDQAGQGGRRSHRLHAGLRRLPRFGQPEPAQGRGGRAREASRGDAQERHRPAGGRQSGRGLHARCASPPATCP